MTHESYSYHPTDLFHIDSVDSPTCRKRVEVFKKAANVFLEEFKHIPSCREKSIAMTRLEEAIMWAVKSMWQCEKMKIAAKNFMESVEKIHTESVDPIDG